MTIQSNQEQMNIVIAGHVDHGKSTVIGRMLADTNSLPDGKLEQVRTMCELNSKPFEYAFLIDALKDEMAQGITIDAARVFFKTDKRDYIIIDAPGHIEFLKNMVTGASRAEAALLVIDADEGVQENSRRHGYMLSMLGISQICVVVNKMDLVDYDENTFRDIVTTYTAFLSDIGVEAAAFIPVSGREGDNIASFSARMPWFSENTVLGFLDKFKKEKPLVAKPFRMAVQDVYKFTANDDSRRLVVGTVDTGVVRPGDEVVFYPSGKRSRVKTIEAFNLPSTPTEASAGHATALTLEEQIYIKRGELAVRADQDKPQVTTQLRASLFWMGRDAMVTDKNYTIKVGTMKVPVRLKEIIRVIDASNLDSSDTKSSIERHDVAECVFKTSRAIAFDLADKIAQTSRFVIVDDYEIRGGGIIREALEDAQQEVRDHVLERNTKWENSKISRSERSERYNQRATLVLVTGVKETGRKAIGKALEARLFADGKIVYYLGMSNVLYGVDADIKVSGETGDRHEHIRRVAEVSNILLDSGMIVVITAIELTKADLDLIETTVGTDKTIVAWAGDKITTDIPRDLQVGDDLEPELAAARIKRLLQERSVIFRP